MTVILFAAGEYAEWKENTSHLFDDELVYAFCQGLRNVYQHDDFVINCTAADQREGSAYLVVSFEHEILSKSLKSGITSHIDEFTKTRRQLNVPPRRNIGTIIQVFYAQVAALYAYYIQETTEAVDEYKPILDELGLIPRGRNDRIGIMATGVASKGFPRNGLFMPYSVGDCQRLKDDLTSKSTDDLAELKKAAHVQRT